MCFCVRVCGGISDAANSGINGYTEPQKTKGHIGRNKSLQRTIIMNPAMKTPVCANPQFSCLHYSFADSKTNINISNININSHETFIPLQN